MGLEMIIFIGKTVICTGFIIFVIYDSIKRKVWKKQM